MCGGGGGILAPIAKVVSPITDPISKVLGTDGGGGGVLAPIAKVVSPITDPVSKVLGTDGGGGGVLGALDKVDNVVSGIGGGGGGGGDGGASQREAERQARITAATDRINSIFNGANRDKMYNEQKSAVYDLNKAEVDRQAAVAERANRFGLARSGLVGGSADVDSNAELNRRTNEGLIRTGGIADQSAADLKLQDEKTRSNLINMAQSGIDTGSAATMALNGLSVNADQAAAQRNGATIGSLFSDLSQAYLVNQQASGMANAVNGSPFAQQWYGVSSPKTSYGGNTMSK